MRETLLSVEEQRKALKSLVLESKRKYRILFLGTSLWGENDVVASLARALNSLGHVVLHVDPFKGGLLKNPPQKVSGMGPVYLDLQRLRHIIDRFEPQLVMCIAGGLCFTPSDAEQ